MNIILRKVILGSSSIYRTALLSKYLPYFISISPNIDESERLAEPAKDLSLRLALEKATKIASSRPKDIVIGSDQVASFENVNIGKPMNRSTAYNQMIKFSDKNVSFYTGAVIMIKELETILSHVDKTIIKFKPFEKKELEDYLNSENYFNTTAGVRIESSKFQNLIDDIVTDDKEAIIGLPMIWLMKQIKNLQS
jgi:septum formation protein